MVKVYCKIETSPWALTLTEPVTEAFELPASDWPEKKFFCPISEEEQPGDSDVLLHDVVLLIDRHSCVARSTGKVSVTRQLLFADWPEKKNQKRAIQTLLELVRLRVIAQGLVSILQ